jgi:MazG family protein
MSAARCAIDQLLDVMAALRTPGRGCPWDLQQTFETIAPYTIEEAYEVADAIEKQDTAALKKELGDLLLQVVYHARIAQERQLFDFDEVVEAITAKMINRHPHVFGTPQQRAEGATPGFWERLKEEERAQSSAGARASVLEGVATALPALMRAVKLQNKAARVGFDWPSRREVFDKLKEELAELEAELQDAGAAVPQTKAAEELGDVLFVIANLARHLGVDPEAALRGANAKFERRFHRIEEWLAARGRTPTSSSLEEMDRLWDVAKAEERNGERQKKGA